MKQTVNFSGVGYCYSYENGQQITKYYSSVARLEYYQGLVY